MFGQGPARQAKVRQGMGNKTEGAQMTIKLKPKLDGLCALLRHQWERHTVASGVEVCKFCRKTRKVKNELAQAKD